MNEINSFNRILFAGDPHGCFDSIIKTVLHYRPEAVIMLGDYSLQRALENYLKPIESLTQIWWIYGNHDVATESDYEYLFKSSYKDFGLHLCMREIAGLKIAGLGGIFMAKNWYPPNSGRWQDQQHWLNAQPNHVRRLGMPIKLRHSIWQHEFNFMCTHVKADILVTHEAPSCHRWGFSAIDQLASAIGAQHIFHGHQHEYYNNKVLEKIAVTGVGKRAVVNLQGVELCK